MELIYQYLRDRQLLQRQDFCARVTRPLVLFKRSKQIAEHESLMPTSTKVADLNDVDRVLSNMGRTMRNEVHQFRLFFLPLPERGTAKVKVGRGRDNDLILADNSVSKRHATFDVAGEDEIYITDDGSKNGVAINGEVAPVKKRVALASGDVVVLGGLALHFLSPSGFYDVLTLMTEERAPAGV